ncbi:MAG: hypothetical protein A2V85_17265 [Chloroflexi bacterium RBG_16_72_14]|nr:MAG: hypothetical protein A2V85_17265 [Chloroflexi bacterium RBG_16_72_14]
MIGKAGDRIVIESERVGQHVREGEILEVFESPLGVNYRVRWDDGHESEIRPSAGSARFVPPDKPAKAGKAGKPAKA